MKLFHSNNASFIFLLLYLHLYKGIAYFSYRLSKVWFSGLIIMLLIMGAGFSGYVLVGSQMSLWAAIVITSLIRILPFVGELLLYFLWGGYSINWLTIELMFLVHFLLPFLVMGVLLLHLHFLHVRGSTRGIKSHSGCEKTSFYPYYWIKDLINLSIYLFVVGLMLIYPYLLGEVELFEESNFLKSPLHIVPEWYFCAFYAILRRIPSKGVGVFIIFLSILVFFIYPWRIGMITPPIGISNGRWVVCLTLQVFLIFLGFAPISQPYILLSLLRTFLYFFAHLRIISLNLMSSLFYEV